MVLQVIHSQLLLNRPRDAHTRALGRPKYGLLKPCFDSVIFNDAHPMASWDAVMTAPPSSVHPPDLILSYYPTETHCSCQTKLLNPVPLPSVHPSFPVLLSPTRILCAPRGSLNVTTWLVEWPWDCYLLCASVSLRKMGIRVWWLCEWIKVKHLEQCLGLSQSCDSFCFFLTHLHGSWPTFPSDHSHAIWNTGNN